MRLKSSTYVKPAERGEVHTMGQFAGFTSRSNQAMKFFCMCIDSTGSSKVMRLFFLGSGLANHIQGFLKPSITK